ncbi:MAG: deoxyribonuclease IV [Patescibacteria group bacterium]
MKIGAHVSAAGGVHNAPENAYSERCACFQFFSRPPQGGKAPELTEDGIRQFRSRCERYRLTAYIHTPYYINLASSNNRIRHSSISVIREELERGSLLGVRAVMTHLGSSKDLGKQAALQKVIGGVKKILDGYGGSAQFLIENSAGAGGTIIGDSFEEIGAIIKSVPRYSIGVCFDTCHAFVSGYDLRTAAAVKQTLQEFNKHIGIDRLRLVHANDAKCELGSRKDRHEHIGYGAIGEAGFRAMLGHAALKKVDWLLETPKDGKDADDIQALKALRTR